MFACRFLRYRIGVFIASLLLIQLAIAQPPKRNPFKVVTPPGENEKLAAKKIELPAQIDQIVAGGGGRYLVMLLGSEEKQLAIFDSLKKQVVSTVALETDNAMVAAGKSKLLLVLNDKRVIQRWNLETLQREVVVPIPTTEKVAAIVMGCDCEDRAMFVLESTRDLHPRFLDLKTMQFLDVGDTRRGTFANSQFRPYVRASASGSVYMLEDRSFTIEGKQPPYQVISRVSAYRQAIPNYNGSLFYTPNGIVDRDRKLVVPRQNFHHTLPSVVLPFFVAIPVPNPLGLSRGNAPEPAFTIHVEKDPRPLVTLTEIDFAASYPSTVGPPRQQAGIDKWFWLMPTQKVLVQVPLAKNSLLVHDVDIEALLEKQGIDYLFVVSAPPVSFSEGDKVDYQLKVMSKNGGVRYSIAQGPIGMEIDQQGKLTWSAPKEAQRGTTRVNVVVSDKSGQAIRHDFELFCLNPGENKRKREMEAAVKMRRERETQLLKEAIEGLPKKAAKAKADAERLAKKSPREFEDSADDSGKGSRTWTDTKGNTVDGELIDIFAGTISLKLDDGRSIQVQIANLIQADKQLVDKIQDEKRRRKRDLALLNPTIQNLKIIGSGFKRFCRNRKRMYKAYTADRHGKPLLSWRVHLLPALGAGDLYALFRTNEPWDSPYNRELIKYMPEFYRTGGTHAETGMTNFLAIRGPHSVIPAPAKPGQRPESSRVTLERAQPFMSQRAADQPLNIAVVAVPDSDAVPWTKPDDWDSPDVDSIKRLFDPNEGGFYAIMDDGNAQLISDQIPPEKIKLLFDRNNRQKVNLDSDAGED